MSTLNQGELQALYVNFVDYRDNHCAGVAHMIVFEFYSRYGLERFAA